MQGTPLTRLDTVEAELASANARGVAQEQSRNGQDHQRVYDPEATTLLKEILGELKNMNKHLELITELEVDDWD